MGGSGDRLVDLNTSGGFDENGVFTSEGKVAVDCGIGDIRG